MDAGNDNATGDSPSFNASELDLTTDMDEPPPALTLGFFIAGGLGLYALAVVTFVGNAMVLHAIRTEKRLQTVSNMFIMSLAVADLIVGLIVMPISALYFLNETWPFGNAICEIWLSVDYTASTASIFNLFVLSLDRYWSITSPLRYLKRRTRKRALVLIGLAWALSLLWLVPVTSWHWILQGGERRNSPQTCDTEFSNHVPFKVTAAVINFYVPSVLMIYLYGRIFYEIRKRSRSEIGQSGMQSSSNRLDRVDEKTNVNRWGRRGRQSDKIVADEDSSDSVDCKEKLDEKAYIIRERGSSSDPSGSSSNCNRALALGQYKSLTLLTIPLSLCQDERVCTVEDCQFFAKVDVQIEYIREPSEPNRFSMDKHIKHKQCYASQVRKEERYGEWRYSDNESLNHLLHLDSQHSSVSHVSKGSDRSARRPPKISNALLQKEKKAAKQLGVIMGAFLLCWLPYFISFMVVAGCTECIPQKIYLTTIWLGYMNSALNPILYPLCNVHFRRAFARMLSFKQSGVQPHQAFSNQSHFNKSKSGPKS